MQIHKTYPADAAFSYDGESDSGLTKREYFAGIALQGLLADSEVVGEALGIACTAVKMADALIDALNGATLPHLPFSEAVKTGLAYED